MDASHDAGRTRYHVLYRGRVQGVCFRANAQDIAHRHAVVGWVRNLLDGDVELEVEGESEKVERFLQAVEARFAGHIRSASRTRQPSQHDETTFEIRY